MPNNSPPISRRRTAVLVVHGMGSQRPLETVRGVLDAVWRYGDNKVWFHPETSGTDIDLTVATTSHIPGTRKRADFHELYWAHLISETRAVAVLLWLFELARRGPHLMHRMRFVWWGGAVFLALLLLSLSFLVLQLLEKVANVVHERYALLIAPVLMIIIAVVLALGVSAWVRTSRFSVLMLKALFLIAATGVGITLLGAAILVLFGALGCGAERGLFLLDGVHAVTTLLLAWGVTAIAARILMGSNCWTPLFIVFVGSLLFFAVYVVTAPYTGENWRAAICDGDVPWSLDSEWTAVVAWTAIAVYLIVNAAFLTPYLGDAARYFRNSPANIEGRREIRRQAVSTLAQLHDCGKYDRIVVVAHSLGSVVAYDMLRAYYSRIRHDFPNPDTLGPGLDAVDQGVLDFETARASGRKIIAAMVEVSDRARKHPAMEGSPPKPWLVTDFVTLGSPLTHAAYLLCEGHSREELDKDLVRRKEERECPTCPPEMLDKDGWLTFKATGGSRHFHHGGLFGLTRWTNLYFPMSQLLWGDAIGGPLAATFGQRPAANPPEGKSYIRDVVVFTVSPHRPDFFAHTKYWDKNVGKPKPGAGEDAAPPHIEELRKAINLADV